MYTYLPRPRMPTSGAVLHQNMQCSCAERFWLRDLSGLGVMADSTTAASAHGGSPTMSPRSLVGNFDMDGIPLLWDNDPGVRARMRNAENLCLAVDVATQSQVSSFVDATVENVKVNACVLRPFLPLMKDHDLHLPAINPLTAVIEKFFVMTKLSRTNEHCYHQAWTIRRLIGRLKKFTYRPYPPQDTFVANCCRVPFINIMLIYFTKET